MADCHQMPGPSTAACQLIPWPAGIGHLSPLLLLQVATRRAACCSPRGAWPLRPEIIRCIVPDMYMCYLFLCLVPRRWFLSLSLSRASRGALSLCPSRIFVDQQRRGIFVGTHGRGLTSVWPAFAACYNGHSGFVCCVLQRRLGELLVWLRSATKVVSLSL